ncbi:hypothetical protein SUGI_0061880 [Cryptomeria japonica]|uniref:uncharacterized protein LOC131042743 n=1 Tax=Cryptomeria japonica TaxID=3369 RepID=UPI002408C233|nr:uncharacterized protein LOC131042743 [Cryptomeria japonica]GLJ07218.1 hypothetical protein SUGI_0061880 [Cryptomeria japonica]
MKLALEVRQKPVKRSFRFLRRNMHKSSRGRATWEANYSLSKEFYALAYMTAERNRGSKLSQHFWDLYSLPSHNTKAGKHSLISTAIFEINELKFRIGELEQRNQTLMNSFTTNMTQSHSSLSHGDARVSSEQDALMHCTSDEVSVIIEETHIADEAIMEVTLKKIASNSTYMELIGTILKCLREMKLEPVRVQCRNLQSTNQVIQVSIRTRTKGEGWQTFEWKKIEEGVKLVLTAA